MVERQHAGMEQLHGAGNAADGSPEKHAEQQRRQRDGHQDDQSVGAEVPLHADIRETELREHERRADNDQHARGQQPHG